MHPHAGLRPRRRYRTSSKLFAFFIVTYVGRQLCTTGMDGVCLYGLPPLLPHVRWFVCMALQAIEFPPS